MNNTSKTYGTLLQEIRRRLSRLAGRNALDENADADHGRILFCAPFRRLQKKAQVFSLEMNAAVRSRLTHSLEVSSIGRLVAQQAIVALSPRLDELGINGKERTLITFVEAACLIHDIGNPPFGHFGELTISEWFQEQKKKGKIKSTNLYGAAEAIWEKHYKDFLNFDGNPQGFRIVTRLQPDMPDDLHGLNLTATTLATAVKYPWTSEKIDVTTHRKKNGYFHTEQDVIDWIWTTLKLTEGTRHPLALLLEAADDIAYCISDIEDGIEKGRIDPRDFAQFMLSALAGTGFINEERNSPMTIVGALEEICNPKATALTPKKYFISAVLRDMAKADGM
ncbi:MAG: dGTP triphosphohydrolase, partial [Vulcanimicrobiaceae bacterium]